MGKEIRDRFSNKSEVIDVFTLIRNLTVRQLILNQLPIFAISLLIAELFYKFHSFALESIAFLCTWYVIDFVINKALEMFARSDRATGS